MNNDKMIEVLLQLITNKSDNKVDNKEQDNSISINDFLINEYVLVRTYSAGVFVGTLKRKVRNEVVLNNARRIWYWEGAASLSQLAEEGTNKPENCKFPVPVKEVLLIGVIEISKVSKEAQESIEGVTIWKK
jgi:hypothetical protein